MKQSLKFTDVIAVGFMLFAFFLGAGNIIFPPLAGQLAGENLLPAMIGFLITAVGLPLLTIIAIALAGGTWNHMTQDLKKQIATLMAVLIFIIIGPSFAAPRTGLVAYEMAVKPFIAEPSQWHLMVFSSLFFVVAMFFSWSQGKLIDIIGKILTPVLFLGLIILAVAVFIDPQGIVMPAQGQYVAQPMIKGFLEGYNTMDTFGALMFGILIVDVLRKKGISEHKATTKYLTLAALIAASGLAFVYVSLFYLGATSGEIGINADNGGEILAGYVQALFGSSGQAVLSGIVLLACLTTAIGLISACSDYFATLTPIPYKIWVIIDGVACAVVANIGLSRLIALSVPVLYALYPVAIALVVLTFFKRYLRDTKQAYSVVLSVSFLFALPDAAKAAGLNVSVFELLPLFEYSMGWLLPTTLALVLMLFMPGTENKLTDKVA